MTHFFLVLCFLSLLIFLIGILKSSWVIKCREKRNIKKVLKVWGFILITTISLIGLSGCHTAESKQISGKGSTNILNEEQSVDIKRQEENKSSVFKKRDESHVDNTSKLNVHFLDVGQADSIFIDYGEYDILIDAGNNDDDKKIINYLKELNTDDIEIFVLTHPHEDHIGAADSVIKAFDVETIIDSGKSHTTKTYRDYIYAAKNEKGAQLLKDDDLVFDMGGPIFKVIEMGDSFDNTNNYSVVTQLDYNDVEFLFTGDLEAEVERANLNKFEDIDILKVGHHGSSTSSSFEFLNKTTPEVSIISAGENNKYGHPHLEALVRLGNYSKEIYGTWQSGDIVVTTDGNTYNINTNRKIDIKEIDTKENYEESKVYNNISGEDTNSISDFKVVIQSISLTDEIVTIKNTSNKDVDLTGWQLVSVKGNQRFNFPAGYILKAGDKVTIASGKANGNIKWTGKYIWNNKGDEGRLYNSEGNLVSCY